MTKIKELFKSFSIAHVFLPITIAIGELITFTQLAKAFITGNHDTNDKATFITLAFLLLIALGFVIFYFTKLRNAKKEIEVLKAENERALRYKEIFKEINHAYNHVHSLVRSDSKDKAAYVTGFTHFCTHLAKVFETATGKKCGICIKFTSWEENGNEIEVKTLCRDLYSNTTRNHVDNGLKHLLKDNTDFSYIFKNINKPEGRAFFCNDLTRLSGYSNTSFMQFDGFESPKPFNQYMKDEDKNKAWPLSYKSCIIAPFYPGIKDKDNAHKHIHGFLCIDSKESDVFNETDKEIIIGCADGLCEPIRNFKELSIKN